MPITITARRDGFRRCDRAHPARPTTYPDDFFTPEELAVLKAEPMLDVREAGAAPSPPAPAFSCGHRTASHALGKAPADAGRGEKSAPKPAKKANPPSPSGRGGQGGEGPAVP